MEYAPSPRDVYITAAPATDIMFIGGATYIWGVDGYAHRERHFYGNGDRRAELFRLQEELHRVVALHCSNSMLLMNNVVAMNMAATNANMSINLR
jgi:hypothetical protein